MRLHSTNNFPEFTGKLCPAPCEEACVLTINDDAVTIKEIEWAIVERAWHEGWIDAAARRPGERPQRRRDRVGAGRAGRGAAARARRARRHRVRARRSPRAACCATASPTSSSRRSVIDSRIEQLDAEGVEFRLRGRRSEWTSPPRRCASGMTRSCSRPAPSATANLPLPAPSLAGVHLAMEYLPQCNRRVAGLEVEARELSARGLRVVVLGGGDTSADCLGNVLREGCASVIEIAHGPTPPRERSPQRTWPDWPFLLRTYPAHEEGGVREWQLSTLAIEGDAARRAAVARAARVPRFRGDRRAGASDEAEEVVIEVDIVLVAIGFTGVEHDADPLYAQLGVELSGDPPCGRRCSRRAPTACTPPATACAAPT